MDIHNNVSSRERIKDAKYILKVNGYYTDNLWHINDVLQNHPNLTRNKAYKIIDDAMQSEWLVQEIFELIEHNVINEQEEYEQQLNTK
jgi:hypothetical protein